MSATPQQPEEEHAPGAGALPAAAPANLSPEAVQAIARALADPRRFAILQQIAANEGLLCSKLDAQDSISPATISHHLRELQEAGLVDARRDGRSMSLSLRRDTWNAYLRQLQQL